MPRCPAVSMCRLQPPVAVAPSEKKGGSLVLFGGGAGMRPNGTEKSECRHWIRFPELFNWRRGEPGNARCSGRADHMEAEPSGGIVSGEGKRPPFHHVVACRQR